MGKTIEKSTRTDAESTASPVEKTPEQANAMTREALIATTGDTSDVGRWSVMKPPSDATLVKTKGSVKPGETRAHATTSNKAENGTTRAAPMMRSQNELLRPPARMVLGADTD